MEKVISQAKKPKNMYLVRFFVKVTPQRGSINDMPTIQTTQSAIYEREIINTLAHNFMANGLFDASELITIAQCKAAWTLIREDVQGLLSRVDFTGTHADKMQKLQQLRNKFENIQYGNKFISYDGILWNEPMDEDEATLMMRGEVLEQKQDVEVLKKVVVPKKKSNQ